MGIGVGDGLFFWCVCVSEEEMGKTGRGLLGREDCCARAKSESWSFWTGIEGGCFLIEKKKQGETRAKMMWFFDLYH